MLEFFYYSGDYYFLDGGMYYSDRVYSSSVVGEADESTLAIRVGIVDGKQDSNLIAPIENLDILSVDFLESHTGRDDCYVIVDEANILGNILSDIEYEKKLEPERFIFDKNDLNSVPKKFHNNTESISSPNVSNYSRSLIGETPHQKEMLIGSLFISVKSIQKDDFDLREYFSAGHRGKNFCIDCEEYISDVHYVSESDNSICLCSSCLKDYTLECARISGNKEVIMSVMSGRI